MAKIKNRVGEKFTTNQGYKTKIIEYFTADNVTIQFEDGGILKGRLYNDLVKGQVKNPNHRATQGIGYFGYGKYTSKENSKFTKAYNAWSGIFERCYSKNSLKKKPTYIGCTVDERWHCFQDFASWFEENCKPHMKEWSLDKDILVKGNKIYSPETCCFVPKEINSLFTINNSRNKKLPFGVYKSKYGYYSEVRVEGERKYLCAHKTVEVVFEAYKTEKERYIKSVADKWKDQITLQTYQAMYIYSVEITD